MAATPALPVNVVRLNVLDLPTDILINVFANFKRRNLDSYGNIVSPLVPLADQQERLRDTQNARLACRSFHRFASPHLLPVLRLLLEDDSLDIVNSLLTSPFVLEGIRLVEVVSVYRPKELAQNAALFKERRLIDLNASWNDCEYWAETWFLGGYDSDDESVCPLPKRIYDQAIDNCRLINSAWREDVNLVDDTIDREKVTEYQRIFEQGYIEYQKKHEEQLRLISDNSFVDAIAMLVSQIPHQCTININDSWWKFLNRFPYDERSTRLLNDMDTLLEFMSAPQDWVTIEELGEESDLAVSALLVSLPIALQRRDTTVQGLHINSFPCVGGHYKIGQLSQESSWDDLKISCQQLKSFVFGAEMNHRRIRQNHVEGEDKACLDRYLSAMLSSSCLEHIHLSFNSYNLNDGTGSEGRHVGMAIGMGAVISSTPYTSLKVAQISDISVQQIELERFCHGIGENLQHLYIYNIEVSGSWVKILDILRQKFSTHCIQGHCRINFSSLLGGEYGDRSVKEGEKLSFKKADIYVLSEKYVSGDDEVTENPLK